MYSYPPPPSFRISHEGIRAGRHNGECHFRKAGGCPPCNAITPVPNIPYPGIVCKHNFPVPISIFHSSLNTDLSGMENHSVNPVAIGKWIDGRIIYRRVYTGTAPTEPAGIISANDAAYILINDFHNEIIDFTGYIQNIAGAKATIKGYYIDQSDWLAVWHQAGAIRMRMPPNGYYVGGPYVLIVTYLQ